LSVVVKDEKTGMHILNREQMMEVKKVALEKEKPL